MNMNVSKTLWLGQRSGKYTIVNKQKGKMEKIYNLKCKNCNKDFNSKSKKVKFCSISCASFYKNKEGIKKEFSCIRCGKRFMQKHKRHFYCSNECKVEQGTATTPVKDVKCTNCGKTIQRARRLIKKGQNFFCTRECESSFRSKIADEVRTCEFCGKDFKCKKHDKLRFCSMQCQSEWQKITGTGKNHPSYNQSIPEENRVKKCKCCGKDIIGTPKHIESRTYCSVSCKTKMNLKTMTIPHKKVIQILTELNVETESEFQIERYSIDCYLPKYRIGIEVMGTFWHCDNRVYSTPELIISKKSIDL